MKFKEGQKFTYTAGGSFHYHCEVKSFNELGSPRCLVSPVHIRTGAEKEASLRVLKLSSFSDGSREIVDIRDQPLTKEQEYENLWV